MFGAVFLGCSEEQPKAERPQEEKEETKATEKQTRKETVMCMTLQWLGHASFKICHEDAVIYIDPWKLKESPSDATLALVSHSHHDHYSTEDIAKVRSPDTILLASADVVAKEEAGEAIMPELTVKLDDIRVRGIAAYNLDKQFHQKANNWVGFVIEIGSKRIYYAGDTDLTQEMKTVGEVDVALLPVGGTYTMNAADAAEATKYIKPEMAIPYHWGDIVGSRRDAEQFAKIAQCDVKVLMPGETLNLE